MESKPTAVLPTKMSAIERASELARTSMVHAQDVRKSYGKKLVLENVDLSIKPGTFLSLVGPSGCGKSTLLRMILGWEFPDSGHLLIQGKPAGIVDTQRGIVFQSYSLLPHLSVLGNISLGLNLSTPLWKRFMTRKEIKEQAMYHLSNMGMADDAHTMPHKLSGGMRQRVAIAQSLIMNPKILLMDEPFGALDAGTRERMQTFLLGLWEKYKMTIVFVTHDIGEAVFLGTRLVLLSQYYFDDRGDDVKRGARVKLDIPLPHQALSTKAKTDPVFAEKVAYVTEIGFKQSHRWHVDQFNLAHPDSFHTLSKAESNTNGH